MKLYKSTGKALVCFENKENAMEAMIFAPKIPFGMRYLEISFYEPKLLSKVRKEEFKDKNKYLNAMLR